MEGNVKGQSVLFILKITYSNYLSTYQSLYLPIICLFPTGEFIGVEYLYAQTGQVLQKGSSDEDNEPSLQVPDGDDEDEGFQVRITT